MITMMDGQLLAYLQVIGGQKQTSPLHGRTPCVMGGRVRYNLGLANRPMYLPSGIEKQSSKLVAASLNRTMTA